MSTNRSVLDRVKIRNPRPGEYPAVKKVVARSFEDHVKANPGALDDYADEPWYDPEHLLVAEIDGQLVSQMGVRTGTLWIDGHPFSAGLVGTVCTVPEWRAQKIGALMVQASSAWMVERGIEMSYLHTSTQRHAFYGRQGYRLSDYHQAKAMFRSGGKGAGLPGVRVRRATAGDAQACNTLYEAHYGRLSGAWSRTEAYWVRRLEGRPKLWFTGRPEFWIAEADGPLAYVAVVGGDRPQIVELAANPGQGAAAAGLVRHVMDEIGACETEAAISPRDPLWHDLADFEPEDRSSYGYVLVRAQDEGSFLDRAGALLAERAGARGIRLRVRLTDGMTDLEVGEGERQVVMEASIHDLCALVYNGRSLDALLESGDAGIGEGQRADVAALFPQTWPERCPMDGY
ncbi:MAG: GNAT family N-acetyltransferase [Candidatus Latescibacteria bacterium]|nr:GNAT family N-acetyltransferase [Candidatus Latescibacterota bacterium]